MPFSSADSGLHPRQPAKNPPAGEEPASRTSFGAITTRDGGRPAQLFRRGTAQTLHPPLTRG
jgi:hypothetical protein